MLGKSWVEVGDSGKALEVHKESNKGIMGRRIRFR